MRQRLLVLAAALTFLSVPAAAAFPTAAIAAPDIPMPPYTPPAGLTATEVTFKNGDTTLKGSIVRKTDLDPSAKHPGIVLVHGSGNATRVNLSQEAEVFARAGIVTLIYDKRSDYSKTHRDFSALANDALAAIDVLRKTSDVNPSKVGLWGLSEGGWVAPLAASRSSDVAYLVTIGAPGHTPSRTQAWNLSNRLARAGVASSTVNAIAGTGMGIAVGLGQFPAAEYDPVPALRAIKQPVLAIWGELDVQVPPRESAEIFRQAIPSSTIRILPHGGHAARVTTDGYDRIGGPMIGGYRFGELSAGYGDMMTTWIKAVTDGKAPSAAADPLPTQTHDSVPVSPVTGVGFASFGVLLIGLLSWPVWALVRRVRGRRGAPAGARPARWLVVTGLAAVLGSTGYVIWAVANSAKGISGLILGQPLPWLIFRALTVAALAFAVAVGVAWWRHRSARLALLAASGLLLVPYALTFGLLLP